MFSGIVERTAEVVSIRTDRQNKDFTLRADFCKELKIDQSIAHNGVCLTVVDITEDTYTVTAMKETLDRSNLGLLREGDLVNLERSMKPDALLDGHIVLSRRLAEEGHYPAIDIEASISRVMPAVVSPEHMARAQYFKQLWSRYQQSRDLISVGAYVAGGDRETDLAISLQPQLVKYLRQGLNDSISLGESEAYLASIFAPAAGG